MRVDALREARRHCVECSVQPHTGAIDLMSNSRFRSPVSRPRRALRAQTPWFADDRGRPLRHAAIAARSTSTHNPRRNRDMCPVALTAALMRPRRRRFRQQPVARGGDVTLLFDEAGIVRGCARVTEQHAASTRLSFSPGACRYPRLVREVDGLGAVHDARSPAEKTSMPLTFRCDAGREPR